MDSLETVKAIKNLIVEVGMTLVLEALGILYLLKAYVSFDWKVASVGILLAFGGVLFEFIVWSNDRSFWATRLARLDENSKNTQERITIMEKMLATKATPGAPHQ